MLLQNFSLVFLAIATVLIAAKIYPGQPPTVYSECSTFHPNQFTVNGVIAECVNTAKMHCKVNPIFDQSLASS